MSQGVSGCLGASLKFRPGNIVGACLQDTTLPPDAVIPEGPHDEVVEGLRREVARLKESEAAAVAHVADLHAQVDQTLSDLDSDKDEYLSFFESSNAEFAFLIKFAFWYIESKIKFCLPSHIYWSIFFS